MILNGDELVVRNGWETLLRQHGLSSMRAVFACADGVVVRSGTGSEVRRIEWQVDGHSAVFFLKKNWLAIPAHYRSRLLRGTLFGKTRVRREYENLLRLKEWGLTVPAPVAFGEERQRRWLVRSFLLTEGLTESVGLDVFIRDVLPTLEARDRREQRRRLLLSLAAVTQQMHAHQFTHRDFHWRNIMLARGSVDDICLLDTPRGRRWLRAAKGRALDLAALDAPAPAYFRRTERLRFFLTYLGHARLTPADKRLLRLVLKLAAPQRQRQLRHVRRRQVAVVGAP